MVKKLIQDNFRKKTVIKKKHFSDTTEACVQKCIPKRVALEAFEVPPIPKI